jgi:hypothetical protein
MESLGDDVTMSKRPKRHSEASTANVQLFDLKWMKQFIFQSHKFGWAEILIGVKRGPRSKREGKFAISRHSINVLHYHACPLISTLRIMATVPMVFWTKLKGTLDETQQI